MVIIYMRISQSISLFIIFILSIAINAGNTNAASSSFGEVADPPPFELMDLTALLNSLNITYEDLAHNLSTLNSPTSSSQSTSTPTSDAGNSNPASSTLSQSQTPPPAVSPSQNTQSTDSKPAKASTGGLTATDSAVTKRPDADKVQSSAKTTNSLQANSNNIQTSQNSAPAATTAPPPAQAQTQTNSKSTSAKPQNNQVQVTPPSSSSTSTSSSVPTPPPSVPTPKSTANSQSSSSYGNSKSSQTSSTVTPPATPTPDPTQPKSNSNPSSSTSSNNFPTFGPGPNDKSLPPVIDIAKLVVDTPSVPTTPSTSNSNLQQTQTTPPPAPKPVTSSSSQSSSSKPSTSTTTSNSQLPADQTSNAQKNTQSKPAEPEVKPSTPQKPINSEYYAPVSQNNPNDVFLPPISSQGNKPETTPKSKPVQPAAPETPVTPVTPVFPSTRVDSPALKPQGSSPEAYQCWIGSRDALYKITPSYKAFSKYFIITGKDAYLPNIQQYLLGNYGNYLQGSQVIAGFRLYNTYGDNSLDYQLLYSTNFGTFTAILTYWPDTSNIQLKSLSIINFYIMEIDYSNCQQQDTTQQNCNICNEGYRNFFGRCQSYDPSCLNYTTDECGKCGNGKRLSNGICQ